VHVLPPLAVDQHPHLDAGQLHQVLRQSANAKTVLPQFHDDFLLALVEQQHVLVDGEVEPDAHVLPLRLLQLALEPFVLQDVDELDGVADALLLVGQLHEGLEGRLQLGGLAAEGDELVVLVGEDGGEGAEPGGDWLQLHPELQQPLRALGLVVDPGELVVELYDVLLQLLADLALPRQQSLPGLEDLVSPADGDLVSEFELVDQDDFVLEEVVVVGDLLIELEFLLAGGLGLVVEVLHVLLLVLAGVAVHVVDRPQRGQEYLLDPVGEHLEAVDLASVELGEFQRHPLEGLVDEVLLGLLGEVELGDRLEEGAVERQRVLEVADEVLDEVLGVFDLLPVEGLKSAVDAYSLALADTPRLHVLLQLLEVELLPFREGDVEQLLLLRRQHCLLQLGPQLLSHLRFH
jgi:hypothetical protein